MSATFRGNEATYGSDKDGLVCGFAFAPPAPGWSRASGGSASARSENHIDVPPFRRYFVSLVARIICCCRCRVARAVPGPLSGTVFAHLTH